jgi:import inner membrane translocase subunit TIM50
LNPPDVRPVLTAYQGKDIATEYATVEAANKARLVEEWKAKHKSNAGIVSGGFTISRLFSHDPDPTHNIPSNSPDGMPLTYLEQKRLLAQKQYRSDVEFLRKNHDVLKKQKEDAQEAQMKEMMQEGLWGALSRMGLGPPPKDSNAPPSNAGPSSGSPVKQG